MPRRRAARRFRRYSQSTYTYGEYVPVRERERRAKAAKAEAARKGRTLRPVVIQGRTIARSTWGRAWCGHIESFHDFENRLPRGRTYVRRGAVMDLEIRRGRIDARVVGNQIYRASVVIAPCTRARWRDLVKRCTGSISSMVELLEGHFSDAIMGRMTGVSDGLFPDLAQVQLACSCPDWAELCKHLAAVLYGVGSRLDDEPELLFTLRGVDPQDLVDVDAAEVAPTRASGGSELVGDLSEIFGIEIDAVGVSAATRAGDRPRQSTSRTTRDRRTATAKRGTKKVRKKPVPKTRSAARGKGSKRARARRPWRARLPAPRALVSRQELLDLGVPSGTIASWLQHRVLKPTAERGVYRQTALSRKRLAQRLSE